jgi:type II secretory pathway pseudopilin PulG
MIEMLGVMAIMGVITVAAVNMIGAAMRNQKRTAVQDEVVQIVSGVRQLLGGYDDYGNLDNSTIFAAISMPERNPYNGKYSLAVNPGNERQFILSIGGLGRDECEYFKQRAWPDSAEYRISNGKMGGAIADPADCSDANGKNTIRIVYE